MKGEKPLPHNYTSDKTEVHRGLQPVNMRKIFYKILPHLPTIVGVITVILMIIKLTNLASGFITLKAEAKQEVLSRELTLSEKQKLFIYENFGDYKTYKKMVRIAECESGFNQSAVNRKSMDFGLFQVNEKTWDETAKSMGLDYKESWEDNILMARFIYQTQGYKAWGWSYKCHFVK